MAESYSISVHLVEARDLVLRTGGVPNPYAEVVVCGRVRSTEVLQECSNCMWDRSFAFDGIKLTAEEYKRETIIIRIKSANILRADTVMGVYAFNVESVHAQKETPFQVRDTWIGVSDLANPSQICAKLRLSVTVLASGDSLIDIPSGANTDAALANAAAAAKEAAILASDAKAMDGAPDAAVSVKTNAAVLLPVGSPEVDRRAALLRVRIYRAEGLPKLRAGAPGTGCSPYVVVKHASETASTAVLSNTQSPVWNEEILMPCFRTGHTDTLRLELWHKRGIAVDTSLLIASCTFSLKELTMSPQRMHWVNLYGSIMDDTYLSHVAVGPGFSGSLVSAFHGMLPTSTPSGRPAAAAFLGRILLEIEVVREPPKRGTRILRDTRPEPRAAFSLVSLRVLEVHGIDVGVLGQVRCVGSFGSKFKASPWCNAVGGICCMNFWTEDTLASKDAPLFQPTAAVYLQQQVWDLMINVYTFHPLNGVTHVGFVRIPPYMIFRDYRDVELRSKPVEAMWLDVIPAYRADPPPAAETAGYVIENLAPGHARMRLLVQAALIQKPAKALWSKSAAGAGGQRGTGPSLADISPFIKRYAEDEGSDGDASDQEDENVALEVGNQKGPNVLDNDISAGGRLVLELGLRHPPMPLPSAGEAAGCVGRIKSKWGREDEAPSPDSSEEDGTKIRSGPRFFKRKLQGKLMPEIIIERKLFCCVYQGRDLLVPPMRLVRAQHAASNGVQGLSVEISTSITSPHRSPALATVSTAPIWYHACVLPLRHVVEPAPVKQVRFASSPTTKLIAPVASVPQEQKDYEYAYLNPTFRQLISPEFVPPGLKVSIYLDEETSAIVPSASLKMTNKPEWFPLVEADDEAKPAGFLLMWLTYEDEVLDQWNASNDVNDIDRAMLKSPLESAEYWQSVRDHWECAKAYGVPRSVAVGLARHIQPWFPVLRPCNLSFLALGMRDLPIPLSLDNGAHQAVDDAGLVEWRIELRVPDAADALLASGQWWRHMQTSFASAPVADFAVATDESRPRIKDQQFAQAVDGRLHARYAPWALTSLRGSPSFMPFPDESSAFRPDDNTFRRSDSYIMKHSEVSISLEASGNEIGPVDGIPRASWTQLRITHPQLLAYGKSEHVIWVPQLAEFAPDATVLVWRRSMLDNGPAEGSSMFEDKTVVRASGNWRLCGMALVPLMKLVASLPMSLPLRLVKRQLMEDPEDDDDPRDPLAYFSTKSRDPFSKLGHSDAFTVRTGVSKDDPIADVTGPDLLSPTGIKRIDPVQAALLLGFRGGKAWKMLEPLLDLTIREEDIPVARVVAPTPGMQPHEKNDDAISVVSHTSKKSAMTVMSAASLASGPPIALDKRPTAAMLAPTLSDVHMSADNAFAAGKGLIRSHGSLAVDLAIRAPTRRNFGVLNARVTEVDSILPEQVAIEIPSKSKKKKGAAESAADKLAWPVEKLKDKMKRQQPGAGIGDAKHLIDDFVEVHAEEAVKLRAAPQWVYEAYATPLEETPWLASKMDKICLYMPRSQSVTNVVTGLLTGQMMVWMDKNKKISVMTLEQTKAGAVKMANSASRVEWCPSGYLYGTFSLLPAEEVYSVDTDGNNPIHMELYTDRYDDLDYFVRSCRPETGGETEELFLAKTSNANVKIQVLPPWLALFDVLQLPRTNPGDVVDSADSLIPLYDANNIPLPGTPSYQLLKVRIVVYRGYGIVDSEGNPVRSFFKLRIEGSGAPDDQGTFVLEDDSGSSGGTAAGVFSSGGGADGGLGDGPQGQFADDQLTTNPSYGKEYILDAYIPGRCKLVLETWYAPIGALAFLQSGTRLGEVRIDLERRWTNPVWRRCLATGRVPTEIRNLYDDDRVDAAPGQKIPKGRLKLWVGVGLPGLLPKPPLDNERRYGNFLPPWEFRVIVWTIQQNEKGTKVPVYATAELINQFQNEQPLNPREATFGDEKPALSFVNRLVGATEDIASPATQGNQPVATAYRTPTHPGRRGTGESGLNLEINWRMRFRLRVDNPNGLPPRLRIRHWRPMPWYSSDRLLSEAVLDLEPLLKQASREAMKSQNVGVQVVNLRDVGDFGTRGRCWIQVSLVPEKDYLTRPVGPGRSAPNQDPYIPEPNIPPQYTAWERFVAWFSGVGILLLLAIIVLAVFLTRK